MPTPVLKFNTESSRRRILAIERALRDNEMNVHQLSDAITLSPRWTVKYVEYLRKHKRVYVSAWKAPGTRNFRIAHYKWGHKSDTAKPGPSARQIARRKSKG